jgi:hypothetical protein
MFTALSHCCAAAAAAAAAAGEAKARLHLRVLEASETGKPLSVEAAIAQLRAARGPDGYDLLEVRGGRAGLWHATVYKMYDTCM